jgi:serine protease inhibitor
MRKCTDVAGVPCVLAAVQHLKQLGVTSSFDRTKADFSKLSPQPLYISDVLQSVSNAQASM